MIHKPLYHGCIDAHGAVPSPDGKLLTTSGRGSSNIYLIESVNKRVLGLRCIQPLELEACFSVLYGSKAWEIGASEE